MASPPYSSGTKPRSMSCRFTFSGSAWGRSILLMAKMSLAPAALAWAMASSVWGMMPSSAAMTMTAMSATLAPRCRMVVKASCPGVSMKTTVPWGVFTSKAPTCWVIPPASFSAMRLLRR